jgi:hypothetical protein
MVLAWVAMAMAMIGLAQASSQAGDAVNTAQVSTEALLSLDGAEARVVEWNSQTASRTLESLVPVPPGEDALIVVAVVKGSMETVSTVVEPAPMPMETGPDGWPITPERPVRTTVDPDSAARPKVGQSGIALETSDDRQTGELTIRIPKDVYATSIEVVCQGTPFRKRAPFVRWTATVEQMPDADCRISFKGGTVATVFTARPGDYECLSIGATALACRGVD